MAEHEGRTWLTWAKANSNRLFLWSMAGLVVVRVLILLTESKFSKPEEIDILPAKMDSKFEDENETYHKVRNLIQPWKNFEYSDYRKTFEFNMFDPKLAQSAEDLMREANDLYDQALLANNRGDTDRALELVNRALSIQPNHLNAKNLRNRIEAKITGGPAEDAAPPAP